MTISRQASSLGIVHAAGGEGAAVNGRAHSMRTDRNIRFATDLVTFYNPAYWGGEGDMDGIGSLYEWSDWTRKASWSGSSMT